MYEHLAWAIVVAAAIGLIKYAISEKDRSGRLILIIVVLGAVAAGLLVVLGQVGAYARAASSAAATAARSTYAGVGPRADQTRPGA